MIFSNAQIRASKVDTRVQEFVCKGQAREDVIEIKPEKYQWTIECVNNLLFRRCYLLKKGNRSEGHVAIILLVEDEATLLKLLREVVKDPGHSVFCAINGQEALATIELEHPDLVISDVMMPVMDGYVLLEQINLKPEWNKIKTILVSAAPINRNHKPPADAYVSKPYDLDLIENLIQGLATS